MMICPQKTRQHGTLNGKPKSIKPMKLSRDSEKLPEYLMMKLVMMLAKPSSKLTFSNGKRKFTKHAKPIKKVLHAEKLMHSEPMSRKTVAKTTTLVAKKTEQLLMRPKKRRPRLLNHNLLLPSEKRTRQQLVPAVVCAVPLNFVILNSAAVTVLQMLIKNSQLKTSKTSVPQH